MTEDNKVHELVGFPSIIIYSKNCHMNASCENTSLKTKFILYISQKAIIHNVHSYEKLLRPKDKLHLHGWRCSTLLYCGIQL